MWSLFDRRKGSVLEEITEKLHGACSSPGAGFGTDQISLQVTWSVWFSLVPMGISNKDLVLFNSENFYLRQWFLMTFPPSYLQP